MMGKIKIPDKIAARISKTYSSSLVFLYYRTGIYVLG